MKAGEFVRKLKRAVIEEGYTINQLTLFSVERKQRCFEVVLINSQNEYVTVYLDED